jgi:hypothetical protein
MNLHHKTLTMYLSLAACEVEPHATKQTSGLAVDRNRI